jgi:hypothetical protein
VAPKSVATVLNPQQLREYSNVDPSLPALITKAGMEVQRQKFLYATIALSFGFLLALAVVGGFIYLAMHDRPRSAAALIGAGVLGLITGFQTVRLGGTAEHEAHRQNAAKRSEREDQSPG